MKTAVTIKERQVLEAVVDSDYHDGVDPVGHYVWAGHDAMSHTLSPHTFRACCGTLAQKGYLTFSGSGREAVVAITAAGMAALRAAQAARATQNDAPEGA